MMPHGRAGQIRKISPQPGFDPLYVQPVTNRYTSYDIPSPYMYILPALTLISLDFMYTAYLYFVRFSERTAIISQKRP